MPDGKGYGTTPCHIGTSCRTEKCAFEGTTRFEDGLRPPLGISVNFPSFAAGILTEVHGTACFDTPASLSLSHPAGRGPLAGGIATAAFDLCKTRLRHGSPPLRHH